MTFHDGIIDGAPPLAIREHGGSGPAVLLVHGIGRTLEDWSLVAPLLCRGHRVVSVDLRGHGRSGEGGWAWEDVVADLERVVRHLDLGRTAIVGHSLGGVVATLYAARHPDCPAAVNIDGHTWLPPDAFPGLPPDIARERLAHMREWMRQQASAMGAPLSEAGYRAVLHAQAALAEQLGVPVELLAASSERSAVRDAQGLYRLRPSGEALRAIHAAMDEMDLLALYPRVSCSLLVFILTAPAAPVPGGPSWLPEFLERFASGLSRDLQALARGQPNLEVELLEAPHLAPLTHPRALAQRINAFLAAHTG